VTTAETLLGMAVLFVAPFLHGSARNQAYQAEAARHATGPLDRLPKLSTGLAYPLDPSRSTHRVYPL
jgi:hypothetical protein